MSGKNIVHLRTTFVAQFAVVDEDGNTLSIHETDPMWTGALTEEEFVKTMQQLRATRRAMLNDLNPQTEPPDTRIDVSDAEVPVGTPCCGENR